MNCDPSVNVSGMHWAVAVIHMTEKRIQFYDSMSGSGDRYLEGLMQYLKDEHMVKMGFPLPDADEWELVESTPDTPQQLNGYDCGVFVCMFCDFLSTDRSLTFSQEHIAPCRKLIALSIMTGVAIEYASPCSNQIVGENVGRGQSVQGGPAGDVQGGPVRDPRQIQREEANSANLDASEIVLLDSCVDDHDSFGNGYSSVDEVNGINNSTGEGSVSEKVAFSSVKRSFSCTCALCVYSQFRNSTLLPSLSTTDTKYTCSHHQIEMVCTMKARLVG